MPNRATRDRARRDARAGKAPSVQAGEFVREEIHHVREGKHGARSAKQAIAIGLSKARRAGIALPPKPGTKTAAKSAARGNGQRARSGESPGRRSRATLSVLKKEPKTAASHAALSRQARRSAAKRGSGSLHAAAAKAVATKGPTGLRKAAQKAAAPRRRAH